MILLEQASESLRNNSPTPRPPSLLSHDPKLVTKPFEIPESSEYRQDHRSRAGTLFESYSSDSDTLSEVTANQPSVVPQPLFSRNVPRFDGKGINILTSNALGLEFLFEGVVLDAQTVAPANSQVESLRTPPIHQDTRSYELLNQKYQEQDEHLVPWFESPANEMLAGGCPRDICLRADASDASGLKTFQRPIPSPGEEEGQEGENDLLNSGLDLGSWWTGTLDGASRIIALDPLDVPLPAPFVMNF